MPVWDIIMSWIKPVAKEDTWRTEESCWIRQEVHLFGLVQFFLIGIVVTYCLACLSFCRHLDRSCTLVFFPLGRYVTVLKFHRANTFDAKWVWLGYKCSLNFPLYFPHHTVSLLLLLLWYPFYLKSLHFLLPIHFFPQLELNQRESTEVALWSIQSGLQHSGFN